MTLITVQDNSHDFNNAFMLALAVLKERVEKLPKEDKSDLFEATKAFLMAESDEDRLSAVKAMNEIMEQRPIKVVDASLHVDKQPLQSWLSYVSKKIREARESKRLTQEQLAEKAGLTQSHISRLEKGDHSPNNKTLQKIANALEVPLATFDPSA